MILDLCTTLRKLLDKYPDHYVHFFEDASKDKYYYVFLMKPGFDSVIVKNLDQNGRLDAQFYLSTPHRDLELILSFEDNQFSHTIMMWPCRAVGVHRPLSSLSYNQAHHLSDVAKAVDDTLAQFPESTSTATVSICAHPFLPSKTVAGKTKWCPKCDHRE